VILDVDAGADDAIAIMLAALSPAVELLGVTTVAGNAVAHTTENSLRVLDHVERARLPWRAGSADPHERSGRSVVPEQEDPRTSRPR